MASPAKRRTKRGFTLIELLVVIAIIGVLSSVVLASLNSAREKARDAKRRADLSQMRTALELYYDNHGTYLVSGTGSAGTGYGWFTYSGSGGYTKSVAQGLVDDGDLGGVVTDPDLDVTETFTSHGNYMIYARYPDGLGVGFCLFSYLENPTAADTAAFNAAPINPTTLNEIKIAPQYDMKYAVCS
jgi:prepilin-type N-terminal cleavage/methylation domain-containing protein